MMGPIYTAISWILLRWHQLWAAVLGDGRFLGTDWPWILSIIFLVITVRIILFPIFVRQIRSQRAMQALQPKMKELQTKHKGDQQTLREEMMKLYQTEKVNPLMGCLPMFLQIPVFLGLFHVLQRLDPVQTLNTTLYGWTQAEWDSAAVARLFNVSIAARFADGANQLQVLQSSGVAVKIIAGVLIVIMMSTTFLSSRQMILKTGWSADPQQRMIQKLMLYGIPFSLLLSGWYFPIGVIVYWVTQNVFNLGQQYWVLRKYPPPVTAGNIPLSSAGLFGRNKDKDSKPAKVGSSSTSSAAARTATVAKRAGGGFVNPTGDTRSGLFRRKREETPAPEPVEVRSSAPKPGAKPITPAKAAPVKAAATPTAASTSTARTSPTKATAAKAGSANGTSARGGSASGASGKGSGATANGSTPSGATANGGTANGATANGTKAPAHGAKPNAGGKPVQRKGGPAKKATPSRKGGSKR